MAVEGWCLLLRLSWGMLKTPSLCILLLTIMILSFHTSFFSSRDDSHSMKRDVDTLLSSSASTQSQAAHSDLSQCRQWEAGWCQPADSSGSSQCYGWPLLRQILKTSFLVLSSMLTFLFVLHISSRPDISSTHYL